MATAVNRVVRHLTDVSEPDAVVARATFDLVIRIVRVQQRGAPLDALSSEILPGLLDIFDARAGALLVHDREEGNLGLTAARGLSASGARLLECLRWGDPNGWDMPLESLRDHRVYLVEQPEDDPFMPSLVAPEPGRAVPNLATIPLHRWHVPLGVLLVIAGPRPLAADDILAHVLEYEVLALALAACATAQAVPMTAEPPPLECARWIDPRAAGRQTARDDVTPARQRDDGQGAIETILHELRATVEALQAERHAAVVERVAIADQLSATENERANLLARVAALETLARAAVERASVPVVPRDSPVEQTAVASVACAAPPEAAEPEPCAPAPEAAGPSSSGAGGSAPAFEARPCRIEDADPERRDRISEAVAAAIVPARQSGLVLVNLLDASAETLGELVGRASSGGPWLGYAADAQGHSRILGPLRCFSAPPTADETVTMFASRACGAKRVITLSPDTDAFGPAKSVLAKAGYSVAMACDEKQALDLLAIIRPDVVLVDLRTAPDTAAEFLDAVTPEGGRVLTLLVVGDPANQGLARALGRLLRPTPLDVAELVKLCLRCCGDGLPGAAATGTAAPPPNVKSKTR